MLVASLLVYVGVVYVKAPPYNPEFPIGELLAAFAAVSVISGVGSLVYRRTALSGPIQRGEVDPRTEDGLKVLFRPFLINLAISESVGLYGLSLAFVSGQRTLVFPFVAAGLVLMYAHRPTAPDLAPPTSAHGEGGSAPPPIA